MTGLRDYVRDPGLTERLGDAALVPPDPSTVLAWGSAQLLRASVASPTACTWEFARWKPGVSITCAYAFEFPDGARELVGLKRYATDKAEHLAERARDFVEDRMPSTDGDDAPRLAGRALVDASTVVWTPAFDRELPGLYRVLDPRRVARWIEEAGLVPPRSVRRRRTALTLVRYKPERRAVLRLDLSLREGPVKRASFAVRVLPIEDAARAAAARRALAEAGNSKLPVVPLVLTRDALGILIEPWLTLTTYASDVFDHAQLAGAALARLHRAPLAADELPVVHAEPNGGPRAFLARFGIATGAASPSIAPTRPPVWTHGDFHPDQVALHEERPHLLDLDLLAPGDPRADLASWIADHLAERPDDDLAAAAEPLLAGYRTAGGSAITLGELAPRVADQLVHRAAAALRRLQDGAVERARTLAARADEIRAYAGDSPGAITMRGAVGALDPRDVTDIARVEVARDGAIHFTVEGATDGGAARWLRYDEHGLSELDPARDKRVPLAREVGEDDRPRVLSWRPGRRIVLDAGTRILKGHRPKRLASAIHAHATALDRNARGGFRLPAIHGVDDARAAIQFERLEGRAIDVTPDEAATFERIGIALRAMQTGDVDGLAPFGAHDEVGVLERWRSRLALVALDPPAGWDDVKAKAVAHSASLPAATRLVPCHRDLHDGQLIAMEDDIGLLDFDLFCAADPAVDIANLRAHLRLRLLQSQLRPELVRADATGVERCDAALLQGLGLDLHAELRARLRFYEATTLLRLALVYAIRPRWHAICPTLTDLATDAMRAVVPTSNEVRP